MTSLAEALGTAAAAIRECGACGNVDTSDPCAICADAGREPTTLSVVEQVADLLAPERTKAFRGRYHVLGGTLSALDEVGPDDLSIPALINRACASGVTEVILALNATVKGQTTAHYITDRLAECGVTVSRPPTACQSAASSTISTTAPRWQR